MQHCGVVTLCNIYIKQIYICICLLVWVIQCVCMYVYLQSMHFHKQYIFLLFYYIVFVYRKSVQKQATNVCNVILILFVPFFIIVLYDVFFTICPMFHLYTHRFVKMKLNWKKFQFFNLEFIYIRFFVCMYAHCFLDFYYKFYIVFITN